MPFVLVMPKAAREALRRGGGIPEAFWGSLSGGDEGPILEWPYELDYEAKRNHDGKIRPVDLPEFFGLGSSGNDDAKKRSNERLMAPLLNRPMVLVAFLDEREEAGGYAQFRSFSEISTWARQLDSALKQRHANEGALGAATRTLVLVAREEQVRAKPEELEKFASFVGNGCVFQSVYFMGRNLQMETGGLFHSTVVWDVMVARLLTAFVLSERETPSQPFYADSGLKVWRSSDCLQRYDLAAEAEMLNLALARAADMLKGQLVPGASDNLKTTLGLADGVTWADIPGSEKLHKEMEKALGGKIGIEGLAQDGLREEWRRDPPRGWSCFDAERCLRETRDDRRERWHVVLDRWKLLFPGWRMARREATAAAERKERKAIYDQAGTSAANVAREVSELRRRLDEGMEQGDPVRHWLEMAEAARSRAETLERLEVDTREFARAQGRYAGLLGGVVVWLAVSLALGWVGYRVVSAWVALTGKGPAWVLPMALVLSGCFALGALIAMVVVTVRHHRAGTRGMEELIRKSLVADQKLLQQNQAARQIISEGVAEEIGGRFRAERFRAWVLLKRLQSMLDTELSPQMVQGRPAEEKTAAGEPMAAHAPAPDEEVRVRDDFLKATRMECMVGGLKKEAEIDQFVAKETGKWWRMTFHPLWRELARGDARKAGHYPARDTVPALRRAVAHFLEELRKAWRMETMHQGKTALEEGEKAWVEWVADSNPLQYASAATTGEHTAEAEMEPASIYCHPDFSEKLKGPRGRSPRGGYALKPSEALKATEWLGLMYQEWRVTFDLDPETQALKFKVVPDA